MFFWSNQEVEDFATKDHPLHEDGNEHILEWSGQHSKVNRLHQEFEPGLCCLWH